MKGFFNSKLVRTLFAILILTFLVIQVDTASLLQALGHITLAQVLYLLLLSVLLIYVSALKWKLFVESFGKEVSLFTLFNLYLVGYFVNQLLPSFVGGDMVRSWKIGKSVGQHEAAAATILERYTGIVAMVTLALGCMWLSDVVTWQIRLAVFLVALGIACCTLLALSDRLLSWVGRYSYFKKITGELKKVQAALHLARRNYLLLAKALLLSFLFHSFTVVNVLAAGAAVGWWDIPVWGLFGVLPLILLVGAIPLSPSGLGIQEGAYLFFLSSIGATPAQALGIGIILRAKAYILALWGGALWLLQSKSADQPVLQK